MLAHALALCPEDSGVAPGGRSTPMNRSTPWVPGVPPGGRTFGNERLARQQPGPRNRQTLERETDTRRRPGPTVPELTRRRGRLAQPNLPVFDRLPVTGPCQQQLVLMANPALRRRNEINSRAPRGRERARFPPPLGGRPDPLHRRNHPAPAGPATGGRVLVRRRERQTVRRGDESTCSVRTRSRPYCCCSCVYADAADPERPRTGTEEVSGMGLRIFTLVAESSSATAPEPQGRSG